MKKITIILFSVVCLTGNAQITPGELVIRNDELDRIRNRNQKNC